MLRKLMVLLIVSGLFSNLTMAQTKEETAVAAAIETLRKAMIDGDKKALDAIAANKLSYGHSSGKVEDKASFVDAIASGRSDFVTIDLTEQSIRVVGNTAIVRHKLSATTNDGGKPGTVNLAILLIWQKQHKVWTLLARQAVKLQ